MEYLCTNCGFINENLLCSNCDYEINQTEYEKLSEYVKRAVHYGYQYRVKYEKQVFESGSVRVKYSLFQPDRWYEWLAMAALSGLVGSYGTDLVKFIGKQILLSLQPKIDSQKLNQEEQKIVTFLLDNNQLNKFTIYINNYYNGMSNIDKNVEEAIIEEEFADIVGENIKYNIDPNGSIKIDWTFLKTARASSATKRREKPNIEEIKLLLKLLKEELKAERKFKKKKKSKKK